MTGGTPEGTRRLRRMPGRPVSVAAFTAGGRRMACFRTEFSPTAVWTDGTEQGSVDGPRPGDFVGEFSGGAVFRAGSRVQVFDGAGLRDLADVGAFDAEPQVLGEHAGTLYFTLWDSDSLGHLACTDGTPGGTRMVTAWEPMACGSRGSAALVNGHVVAPLCEGAGTSAVRSWDAATDSAVRIALPAGSGAVSGVVPAPDGLSGIVTAVGGSFVTDGTPEGTVPFSTPLIASNGTLGRLDTPAGTRTIFMGSDRTAGIEPWATDGTAAGTRRLADLRPGRASSTVAPAGVWGGRFWFTSDSGVWSTDGTPAGTANASTLLVRPSGPLQPYGPFAALAGGRVCFSTASEPDRLHTADAAGNAAVILPDRAVPLDGPSGVATLAGGLAVFVWVEPGRGPGVFMTDGTSLGTRRIADLDAAKAWSAAGSAAGLAWFSGTPASGPGQVWRSDGTPEGTFPVGEAFGATGPFVEGAGGVVFGRGLFWSDGRPAPLVANARTDILQYAVSPGGRVYYFRPSAGGGGSGDFCVLNLATGEVTAIAGVPRQAFSVRLTMRFFGERALVLLGNANWSAWVLDGETATALPLAVIPRQIEAAGDRGLIVGFDSVHFASTAWVVDPATGDLTAMPLPSSTMAVKLATWGGSAVMLVGTSTALEAWTIDGTPGGVRPVGRWPGVPLPSWGGRGPLVDGDWAVFPAWNTADPSGAAAVNLRTGALRRVGRTGDAPDLRPGLSAWYAAAGESVVTRGWTEAAGWQLYGIRGCAADMNADGFLDLFDWSAYVASFESGVADADFNGDGFVDFFDYDAFVGAFEAGCGAG